MHGDNGGGVARKQYNPDHFPLWVAALYASIFATIGLVIGSPFIGLPVWLAMTIGLCLIVVVLLLYVVLFTGREMPPIQKTIPIPSFDLNSSSGWSWEMPVGGWVQFDPMTKLVTLPDGTQMNEAAFVRHVQWLADMLAGTGVYRVEVVR